MTPLALGERSVRVRAIQEALVAAGIRVAVDGDLGPLTATAMREYARRRGIPWVLPGAVVEALEGRHADAGVGPIDAPSLIRALGLAVLDLRSEAPRVKRRDPASVTGVTLHQTAVVFGARPEHTRRAGGNADLAAAYRVAEDVPVHAVAMRSGYVVLRADVLDYLPHAGRLNASTLGLEIEGRYPGLEDDPSTLVREDLRTLWGDASRRTLVTPGIVAAAAEALRLLVEHGRAADCPLQHVYAHRQSSEGRRSDPGQGLWRALMPVCAELGLTPRPTYTVGKGRPIPAAWGGSGAY